MCNSNHKLSFPAFCYRGKIAVAATCARDKGKMPTGGSNRYIDVIKCDRNVELYLRPQQKKETLIITDL